MGAGRPKGSGKAKKSACRPKVDRKKSKADPGATPGAPGGNVLATTLTPLDYMLRAMNDPAVSDMRKDRLAVAAAPYCHPKISESGKKEQVRAGAKTAAAGRFGPSDPPKLVVSNR